MRAVAELFAREADRVDLIHTSPLVRAVQTAEIIAAAVGLDDPLIVTPEIASPPGLDVLIELIEDTPANLFGVALVGHEPILSALASRLIGRGISGFSKGEVYALRYARDTKQFTFHWRITPEGPALVNDLER